VSWRALLPACSPRAWWCGKRCARISYTKRKDKKGTDRYNTYPSCPGSPPINDGWLLIDGWSMIYFWLVVTGTMEFLMTFPFSWEWNNDPNWRRTHIFQRGRAKTTNQVIFFWVLWCFVIYIMRL
jgi:hypothetical protein